MKKSGDNLSAADNQQETLLERMRKAKISIEHGLHVADNCLAIVEELSEDPRERFSRGGIAIAIILECNDRSQMIKQSSISHITKILSTLIQIQEGSSETTRDGTRN